jgi:hypothetical protein
LSAVQVSRLVVLCRTIIGPAEVRIVRRQIFVSRIRPMAAVAVRLAVNDEASPTSFGSLPAMLMKSGAMRRPISADCETFEIDSGGDR